MERRSYASSVTTQTSSSFSFSGCGNRVSRLWCRWRSGIELCRTSITSWLLSGTQVSSFLECTPSQVVIPCRNPSTRESLPQSANSEKETFPELYSVVGEETATLEDLLKTGQTFFATIVWPAKVPQFECRQIHDLHKEERQTTTRDVASSDGQKSAPSHAQSTPSNDTLEGSRQAGCPSNYHHGFWLGDA